MSIIIKNFFGVVDTSVFRRKSISKGKKPVESCHVSEVQEEISNESITLTGLVLRETPGAHSTKKHENIYKPVVQV